MKIDDAFNRITTLVKTSLNEKNIQGTGFFYQELAPSDPAKKGGQWREIKQLWLVTNRHVLLPRINGTENVPNRFSFHLRKIVDNKLEWEPIELNQEQLLERARFHSNREVDVCVIRILDLLTDRLKSGEKFMPYYHVSKEQLPGNNKIEVSVSDDAVIIGYPRGFYDEVNLFPIIKSGIIASRWGVGFNGLPYFLIDAKLFPGSSGSIVISKPMNFTIEDGKTFYALDKQFAFLGVYSGEPYQEAKPIEFDDLTIIRKSGFNVGIVWYGSLIEEILGEGIQYAPKKEN